MTSIPLNALEEYVQQQRRPVAKLKAWVETAAFYICGAVASIALAFYALYVLGDRLMPLFLVIFALGGMGVAHD